MKESESVEEIDTSMIKELKVTIIRASNLIAQFDSLITEEDEGRYTIFEKGQKITFLTFHY